ncbi:DUF560 domain-containing protein [Allopusillimonas ginsengisoli]|nr:DUF560 domain-containing protein [Allopusillimonas ginsengisoli]
MSWWKFGWAMFLVPLMAFAAPVPADPELLGRAQDWLQTGQGRTAYGLLEPHEAELAGLPAYDYLLGQAALAAKEPTRAALAFERCLAVEPLNGTCRLGMARAHIALSEVDSARIELGIISRSAPPEPVQDAVAHYLGLLSSTRKANDDRRLSSYLEVGIGYDSNINSATSVSDMALPVFGGAVFRLSREGRKQSSGFNRAAFNLRYSAPLAEDWRYLLETNIAGTGNWTTQDYNNIVSDVSAGLVRQADRHQLSARVLAQHYALGGHTYRNTVGVLGQYAYTVTDRSEFSAFAQASRLSYPDQSLRNANRYTGGVSWSQAFANDRAVAYGSVYGGWEETRSSAAPRDYAYRFSGVRAGGLYLFTPRIKLEVGVGAERRMNKGKDLLFQTRRRETLYDAFLGLDYSINRKLSLRPQYRFSHSDANTPLRDFQRHVFTVNLRYELF